MRLILPFAVLWCLGSGLLAGPQGQGPDATSVLTAARNALGGDQKLAAIKTFVARGRTRQVRGNNLVPIEFEIACELPDKYVRRDEIPAQESGPTSTGFNGDSLIQLPPPPEPPPQAGRPAGPGTPATAPPAPSRPGGPSAAPPDPRKARVVSIKQDFAKLTLGMFATSFSSYPLTFALAGQAEAPQGTADVIEVKGAGNLAVKFFINKETHLPIMVSWTTPAANVVLAVAGQPAPQNLPPGSVVVQIPAAPGPAATKEDQEKYSKDVQDLRKKALAGAKPIEHRLYYSDYRDVGGGVRFPFRLRRATAGETIEETNFDEFKINARIDARRFEAVK